MRLVEIAQLAVFAAGIIGRQRLGARRGRQVGEVLRHEIDHADVFEIAGSGDDEVLRRVVRLHVAAQRVRPDGADDLLGAEGGPAHRLVGIGGELEMVEHDIVRRVVRLADLLQDDAALALEFRRIEGGMAEDVADDVDTEGEILLQQLDVIGGLLARGVGVDVAADILDRLGDGGGTPALGALEGHVFEEMRDAVFRRRLVAGADAGIGAEGDGLHPVHPFGQDGQAGVEFRHLHCVTHASFLCAKWRTRVSTSPRLLPARTKCS